MNWEMPARPYVDLQLPVEGITGPAVNMVPKPIPSPPQGSPRSILSIPRLGTRLLDVNTYSHNHQVDAEAYTVGVYLSSQSRSTIWSVDEGASSWGSHTPENRIVGVDDNDFPTTCFSDPEFLYQTMSPRFTASTSRVSEGLYSATVISDEDQRHVDLVDGDKGRSWYQESLPPGTLLDHNHQYTHVRTISDSPVSSTLSAGVHTTPTVQHRDERTSRDMPQGSNKSEEGPVAESQTPLRSIWKHGAPRRYRCTCGREYAQPQGLTRHRRDTHAASICTYCGSFAWARPYRFKEHLSRKHPEVDPDAALKKATRLKARRGVTIKAKDLPQCTSPPAKRRSNPSSSFTTAMRVAPPVSPPAVSPSGYDSEPNSAEPSGSTMEMRGYEDTSGLSNSYYTQITIPPSKQSTQIEKARPEFSAGRGPSGGYRPRIARTQSSLLNNIMPIL